MSFKVGDLAIIVSDAYPEFNGQVCEILVLKDRQGHYKITNINIAEMYSNIKYCYIDDDGLRPITKLDKALS